MQPLKQMKGGTGHHCNNERIREILQHAEAKGRSRMAEHLAYSTDASVEQAGELLAIAPKGQTSNKAQSIASAWFAAAGGKG